MLFDAVSITISSEILKQQNVKYRNSIPLAGESVVRVRGHKLTPNIWASLRKAFKL